MASKKKTTKKTAKPRPKAKSQFETLVRNAPPREKVNKKVLTTLMTEYARLEDEFNDIDIKRAELMAKRDGVAEKVVSHWGRGVLVYEGRHYMPSSANGRIILRRLGIVDGVLQ